LLLTKNELASNGRYRDGLAMQERGKSPFGCLKEARENKVK